MPTFVPKDMGIEELCPLILRVTNTCDQTAFRHLRLCTLKLRCYTHWRNSTPTMKLRAYHGTSLDSALSIQREQRFRASSADRKLGRGVYLSPSLPKAQFYAVKNGNTTGVILTVEVDIDGCDIQHVTTPSPRHWPEQPVRSDADVVICNEGTAHHEICVRMPARVRVLGVTPVSMHALLGRGYIVEHNALIQTAAQQHVQQSDEYDSLIRRQRHELAAMRRQQPDVSLAERHASERQDLQRQHALRSSSRSNQGAQQGQKRVRTKEYAVGTVVRSSSGTAYTPNFDRIVNYETANVVSGPSRANLYDVQFANDATVYKMHADDIREVRTRRR